MPQEATECNVQEQPQSSRQGSLLNPAQPVMCLQAGCLVQDAALLVVLLCLMAFILLQRMCTPYGELPAGPFAASPSLVTMLPNPTQHMKLPSCLRLPHPPATTGPQNCWSSLVRAYTHCFTGSYTAMNRAEEGATPARLPHTPAYSPLPPPDCSSAFQPPPPIMACRRVLMVSMGYKAGGEEGCRHTTQEVRGQCLGSQRFAR